LPARVRKAKPSARTPARKPAKKKPAPARRPARAPAGLATAGAWDAVFQGRPRAALEKALPRWLEERRWFGGKARGLRGAALVDAVPVPCGTEGARFALVEARYGSGKPETYSVPLSYSSGERAQAIRTASPGAEVTSLDAAGRAGCLFAAEADPAFARALLDAVAKGGRFPGPDGDVVAWPTRAFAAVASGAEGLEPRPLSAEQSNTSIRFGDRLVLKLFRRTEPGPNPDLEIGAFLTEVAGYRNTPPVLGGIEYRPRRGEAWSLGILQAFVPNEGDAWRFTLDAVARFFERAAAHGAAPERAEVPQGRLLDLAGAPPAASTRALVGPYLDAARLLGTRTAELHVALSSHPELPAFAPEPYTPAFQRDVVRTARTLVKEVFQLLRRRRRTLADDVRARADRVLAREGEITERMARIGARPFTALRTRAHGDYHLGQVLWTGQDFMIIDFEGEPARPLAARRAKVSPLRDVAGMLRSFHYAAFQGLATHGSAPLPAEQARAAEAWARVWQLTVSGAYLGAYLQTARGAPFLPASREELEGLLDLFLAEKAIYELSYELNNRPAWVGLPLQGIADLLAPAA